MRTYIQIGANVGLDDFQKRLESLDERTVVHLIEANPNLIPTLKSNYSSLSETHEIHIHCLGISIEEGKTTLNFYTDSGLSSLLHRNSYNHIQSSIEIDCVTFDAFCAANDIVQIEYLTVDCEGMDYEILNSIDIDKIDIAEISFEVWPYENDDLAGKYRTGESFLNGHLIPKYENYVVGRDVLDGMDSLVLVKRAS